MDLEQGEGEVPGDEHAEGETREEEARGADRCGKDLVVDDEDVAPRRVLNTPYQPSQSEIDEHMVDHIPFRHWCRCCLEGFGRESPHCRVHGDRVVPIISFDYLFVTRRGVVGKCELKGEEQDDPTVLKVIAVRDSASRAITAHAVPQKGVDSDRFSVSCIVDFVLWLGYSKVILMSDNEKPIIALLREALLSLRVEGLEQAMEQHPVPYDPAGNGSAEVGDSAR